MLARRQPLVQRAMKQTKFPKYGTQCFSPLLRSDLWRGRGTGRWRMQCTHRWPKPIGSAKSFHVCWVWKAMAPIKKSSWTNDLSLALRPVQLSWHEPLLFLVPHRHVPHETKSFCGEICPMNAFKSPPNKSNLLTQSREYKIKSKSSYISMTALSDLCPAMLSCNKHMRQSFCWLTEMSMNKHAENKHETQHLALIPSIFSKQQSPLLDVGRHRWGTFWCHHQLLTFLQNDHTMFPSGTKTRWNLLTLPGLLVVELDWCVLCFWMWRCHDVSFRVMSWHFDFQLASKQACMTQPFGFRGWHCERKCSSRRRKGPPCPQYCIQ